MPFFNDGREAALHQHVMSLAASEPLQDNPIAVLDAIHKYIESHTRMMTFQPPKIAKSREILERMDPKPKVIVELGTYVGNSAVAWGAMLKEWWQHDPEALRECRVYSCELETNFCEIARDFVTLAGLEGVVSVEQGKSEDTIRRLLKEGKLSKGGVDMLFIDHWEDAYQPDLKGVEELDLLHQGSVIIADNTDIPGAPEYLTYVQASSRYRSETLDTMPEEEGKEQEPKKKGRGHHGKMPNLLEVSWVL